MKYLQQFFVILAFSFVGEWLHGVIPMQIPASIYGLVSLFVALITGLIKLSQVREAAKFLIVIMPLMFIPAGVGLINSWDELRPILLPVAVIMVVSTILVMGISGRVTQLVIRLCASKDQGTGGEA